MDDLKALFDHVVEKTPDFARVELEKDGVRLLVERAASAPVMIPMPPAYPQAAPSAPVQTPQGAAEAPAPTGTLIKSPIVGTFYASPSPDAPPFVSEGQSVKKGQVLCIIEAMKMMNEIESEIDGVVLRVLVKNGELVEFGQALFELA